MICYLLSISPPSYIGGVEVYISTLTKYLKRSGITPILITSKPKNVHENMNVDCDVIIVDSKGDNPVEVFNNFIDGAFMVLLKEISKQYDKDIIVHAHGPIECYVAIRVKEHRKFPLIFTMHDIVYREWYEYFKKVINNIDRVDGIYTLSNYMKKYLSNYGIHEDEIDVIPGGIDRDIFDIKKVKQDDVEKLKRLIKVKKDEKIIFYPSRIDPLKGIDVLIRSLDYIDYDVKLVLTGGPSLKDTHLQLDEIKTYKLKIKSMRTRNVIWASEVLGNISYQILPVLYYLSDVTTIPSLSEPFGLVAVESMSMMTPVVASNTGGLREIIRNDVNGILVTPGDYRELAQAIVRLIEDKSLYDRLSKNGYDTAKMYSFDNLIKKIITFYEQFL